MGGLEDVRIGGVVHLEWGNSCGNRQFDRLGRGRASLVLQPELPSAPRLCVTLAPPPPPLDKSDPLVPAPGPDGSFRPLAAHCASCMGVRRNWRPEWFCGRQFRRTAVQPTCCVARGPNLPSMARAAPRGLQFGAWSGGCGVGGGALLRGKPSAGARTIKSSVAAGANPPSATRCSASPSEHTFPDVCKFCPTARAGEIGIT